MADDAIDVDALNPEELLVAEMMIEGKGSRKIAEALGKSHTQAWRIMTRGNVAGWVETSRRDMEASLRRSLVRAAPAAVGVLMEIATRKEAADSDRIRAASKIADLAIPREGRVEVQHTGTVNSIMTQATDTQLLAVLKKLGVEVDD